MSSFPKTRGKYTLVAELGRGGLGAVHLAVATWGRNLFRPVAVKSLHPEYGRDIAYQALLADEARVGMMLEHPNVVGGLDWLELEPGRFALAMPYVEGTSFGRLRAELRNHPAFVATLLLALRDVLEGLRYAHNLRCPMGRALRLVHRDISPHNILVNTAGNAKIIDFGVAQTSQSTWERRLGSLKGKIAYMAPEQARGEPVDARADLFSVGVLLWETLMGQRMWRGLHDQAIFDNLVRGVVPNLRDFRNDVPERVETICQRALSPQKSERYATAESFLRDLDGYLGCVAESVPTRPILGGWVEAIAGDRIAECRMLMWQAMDPMGRHAPSEPLSAIQLVRMKGEPDDTCESPVPIHDAV